MSRLDPPPRVLVILALVAVACGVLTAILGAPTVPQDLSGVVCDQEGRSR